MRTTAHPAHFRNRKDRFLIGGMSNRHSDTYEFVEQPHETAPFVKGILVALVPALLCWAAIIEGALKLWRQFSH
jgi:hypothetical protein